MMRSHEKWSIHIDLVHKEYANSMFRFPELYYERSKQDTDYGHPERVFFSNIPNISANWADQPNNL